MDRPCKHIQSSPYHSASAGFFITASMTARMADSVNARKVIFFHQKIEIFRRGNDERIAFAIICLDAYIDIIICDIKYFGKRGGVKNGVVHEKYPLFYSPKEIFLISSPQRVSAVSETIVFSFAENVRNGVISKILPFFFHFPATMPSSITAGITMPARLKMPRRYPAGRKMLSAF